MDAGGSSNGIEGDKRLCIIGNHHNRIVKRKLHSFSEPFSFTFYK